MIVDIKVGNNVTSAAAGAGFRTIMNYWLRMDGESKTT